MKELTMKEILHQGFMQDFGDAAAAHKIKEFCWILYERLHNTEAELRKIKNAINLYSDAELRKLLDLGEDE